MNSNFIQSLSNVIYTQEGIQKAQEYLKSRDLDSSKLRYPYTISSGDENIFKQFSSLYPPNIFLDSLYIPIVSILDPNYLVGFEVRYLGSKSFRTRFHKFKLDQNTLLMYFSKDIEKIEDDEPIIVTEGIMDALSVEQLGYTVISPLTALHNLKFCLFLYSISNNIYIMYDNDTTGRKACSNLMKGVSLDLEIQKSFNPIIYTGKDPNQALLERGEDYLKQILRNQIRI